MPYSLIDTHVHLDHMENLDEELRLASEAGVSHVVAMSVSVDSFRKNLEILQKVHPVKIFLACGIHPAEADVSKIEECCDLIRQHQKLIVAVGEVGLDFWYKHVREDDEKKAEQKKVFRALCELARELNLPVVVHARGAHKPCLEILLETKVQRAVFHWYDSSVKMLKNILDAGYVISATPNLSYNPATREAITFAPSENVLIETDSPVRFFNRYTEEEFQAGPKEVVRTLKAFADLKNISVEQAAEILNQNAIKFFDIDA